MVASVADDSQSVFLEAPDFLHSNVEPPNSLFTEFCGIRQPSFILSTYGLVFFKAAVKKAILSKIRGIE
jgi:hypothetical protein